MPPVACQKRYSADQSGGRAESILAFQHRILPPKFSIATGNSRRNLNLTVTLEMKENRPTLSIRKTRLSQQLFPGNDGIVDLPLLAFQVVTILPMIQVVNKNVSINQKVTLSHA